MIGGVLQDRVDAWNAAIGLIEPIVEAHGLEEYHTSQTPFTRGSTFTKVDQHINHVLNVANWLIGLDI
jgi:hypothetical protein